VCGRRDTAVKRIKTEDRGAERRNVSHEGKRLSIGYATEHWIAFIIASAYSGGGVVVVRIVAPTDQVGTDSILAARNRFEEPTHASNYSTSE
jgi:hypothetical protein